MADSPNLSGVSGAQLEFIVKTIRAELPNAKISFFGSRTTGKANPYSDLDVAIETGLPIAFAPLSRLREAFSESDLPFKVDLVDYFSVDADFRAILDRSSVAEQRFRRA